MFVNSGTVEDDDSYLLTGEQMDNSDSRALR